MKKAAKQKVQYSNIQQIIYKWLKFKSLFKKITQKYYISTKFFTYQLGSSRIQIFLINKDPAGFGH